MSDRIVPVLLLVLAVAGLANAVYFTLIYYRAINPDSEKIPSFCRVEERTCQTVVFTRYGRLFLVPNSLLGIVFYLLVLDVALSKLLSGEYALVEYALAGAAASVLAGVYLVYALLVKLKARCSL